MGEPGRDGEEDGWGTPLGSAISRPKDPERERAGVRGGSEGEGEGGRAEGMVGAAKLLASEIWGRADGLHLLGVAITLAAGLRPRLRSRRDERG